MKMLWGPVSPVLASILSVAVTSVFFCIGEILLLVNILRVFLVIKVGLQSSWKAHCLCKCSLFFIYQKRSVKFPSSRSPSTTWITRCPREWWSSLSWSSTLLSTWPEVVFLIKIDVLMLFIKRVFHLFDSFRVSYFPQSLFTVRVLWILIGSNISYIPTSQQHQVVRIQGEKNTKCLSGAGDNKKGPAP